MLPNSGRPLLKKWKQHQKERGKRQVLESVQRTVDDWLAEKAKIDSTIDLLTKVKEAYRFSFEGVTLIETRSKTNTGFASAPIKIGAVKVRVGGAQSVRTEQMTAIDHGTFTVDHHEATFVGGHHTRTWEYKKLVGYDTQQATQMLIAVRNRQKMSGIRYPPAYDFQVDAIFCAAVERFNGADSAVQEWIGRTADTTRQRLNDAELRYTEAVEACSSELVNVLGAADAIAFVDSLPNMNADVTRPGPTSD